MIPCSTTRPKFGLMIKKASHPSQIGFQRPNIAIFTPRSTNHLFSYQLFNGISPKPFAIHYKSWYHLPNKAYLGSLSFESLNCLSPQNTWSPNLLGAIFSQGSFRPLNGKEKKSLSTFSYWNETDIGIIKEDMK